MHSTIRFPQVRLAYGSPAPNAEVQGCDLVRVVSEPADSALEGDRQLAARLLVGEVLGPGGRLYTYSEVARLSGTPKTTLYRLAGRLGVAHLRTHRPQPELRRTPELARILAQQAEILHLIARQLG